MFTLCVCDRRFEVAVSDRCCSFVIQIQYAAVDCVALQIRVACVCMCSGANCEEGATINEFYCEIREDFWN